MRRYYFSSGLRFFWTQLVVEFIVAPDSSFFLVNSVAGLLSRARLFAGGCV